ncbi:MAG TPA: hypothetical protein VMC10_18000 [Stellaceae bacterium]|nr:hypothetical protein [Stellaceae bacterium]
MAEQIAIALFRSFGTAEDARNRFLSDGVDGRDLLLRRLAKDTVVPPEESQEAIVSFPDWLFGNDLPTRYGVHVGNGETILCVRVASEDAAAAARDTLRQYGPLQIECIDAAMPAAQRLDGP